MKAYVPCPLGNLRTAAIGRTLEPVALYRRTPDIFERCSYRGADYLTIHPKDVPDGSRNGRRRRKPLKELRNNWFLIRRRLGAHEAFRGLKILSCATWHFSMR
jgi:hypothetical protein